MVLNKLKSLFKAPQPAGPPQALRVFSDGEPTITLDGVSADSEGWRIESEEARTVRMFEVPEPGVEKSLVMYRARLKTQDAKGRVYLEMWCQFPGRGEFFSKGFQHAIKGTTDWASCETPFILRAGERPDLIKLNIVTEGPSTVWAREMELLVTPLK